MRATLEALAHLTSTQAVQGLLGCSALDVFMKAMSTAGEGWFLSLLALCLAWRTNRNPRTAAWSALRWLAALAVTGALTQVVKRMVDAPRPLRILGPERVRVLLEPLHNMSFPSGHSAAAAAFAFWASRQPSARTWRWPWLLAFLVGLSRVYVGAHWATDVLGGWMLGAAVASLVCRTWRLTRPAAAMVGEASKVGS